MTGSVAEERIRAKAEVMLRRRFPDARIVHELVLQQGGCRIDLAAICPDFIVAIEVKSERDELTRLPRQAEAAMKVVDLFGVCIAMKHASDVVGYFDRTSSAKVVLPYGAELLRETGEGFDEYGMFEKRRLVCREPRLCNPADRLEMLWAEELRAISGTKLSRQPAKHLICETMTGREIRRAVCRELRSRTFPRADAPILSELAVAA